MDPVPLCDRLLIRSKEPDIPEASRMIFCLLLVFKTFCHTPGVTSKLDCSLSDPLFDSKCCVSSKNFEVSILVQDYNIISDGDRGDQAIDKFSDGLSICTTLAVKDCRLVIVDWSCVKN